MVANQPENRPGVFYKYRSLADARTLDCIKENKIYLSRPDKFNDPLDCAPTIKCDTSLEHLRSLMRQLTRISSEPIGMTYNKLETNEDYLIEIFCESIAVELLRQIDCGIFSMSETNICPLMWSHYGDQHKGVCIGYRIKESSVDFIRNINVRKVEYGGDRTIPSSEVQEFIWRVGGRYDRIKNLVYLRKAKSWEYEREWRILGGPGLNRDYTEICEITFGLRATDADILKVVGILPTLEQEINFYKISSVKGDFTLERKSLDISSYTPLNA